MIGPPWNNPTRKRKFILGDHHLQTCANLKEQPHKGQEATGPIEGTRRSERMRKARERYEGSIILENSLEMRLLDSITLLCICALNAHWRRASVDIMG